MKPHLTRSEFATTLVLASVISFPVLCQKTQPYDVCREPLKCGNIDLEYPFWGSSRPAYCGHPGFQLTCQSNVPELVYKSVSYRVLDTDSSTQTITVARNDLWTNDCPQYLHNTTYNTTLFNGDNFDQQNVSVYYRCDDSIPVTISLPAGHRLSCNANNTETDSYFYVTDLIRSDVADFFIRCGDYITVPVNRSSAARLAAAGASRSDLGSALTAGFNLQWTANNDECERCVQSDGQCGSNLTSPDLFACYCAGGSFSLTCNNVDGSGGSSKSNSLSIALPIVGAVIVGVGIGWMIFVYRQRRKRRAIKGASSTQTESKAILTKFSNKELVSNDNSNFTSSIPPYPSPKTSETSKEFGKTSYFGAQVFAYEELEVATDNFNGSRELGDGGFGTVYYGKLLDGREVAVKCLHENSFRRMEQFMNEVRILTGLDHENLLISSLQAVDTNRHRLDINLANMAMTKIQNHMLDELVDKSIGFETNGLVRRTTALVAELAFRCLQQQKDMRPTMKEVVETLRGIQNDDSNAQKPEVLDIVVDDGGLLKGHNTEPTSPDYGDTNKLVGSYVPNSSSG
ncbi:hypothetical protein L1987_66249 [Smallanthus sonchifolius]|uniref:Uncharacterized protein n=1 Tax=Smallanthus sonchifolius TaxID=185202 RepID=A0ACB9BWL2_9ASTR|nr:hypothetical protein L1987_66249 [Smallanthus sonchifolius]